MKTIDQIFAKTIIFLWEVSQIFFLLPFLAFRSDGGKKVKRQSIPFTSRTELFVQSSTFAKLWNFIVLLFIPLYDPFIWPNIFLINNFVSYVNRRIAIYHEHAVLFFHFDRKWLGIFLSKVSRQKTRDWYRANYSHFHRNKNWNSFIHSYILLSRSEFSFHLPS